jgi:hypothetical protein
VAEKQVGLDFEELELRVQEAIVDLLVSIIINKNKKNKEN